MEIRAAPLPIPGTRPGEVRGLHLSDIPAQTPTTPGTGPGGDQGTGAGQPHVTKIAKTQNYLRTQIDHLSAQAAQVQLMLAKTPLNSPSDPVGAYMNYLQSTIASYTKAMATAPDAPGDQVIYA